MSWNILGWVAEEKFTCFNERVAPNFSVNIKMVLVFAVPACPTSNTPFLYGWFRGSASID